MVQAFKCPSCEALLTIGADADQRTVRCPACKSVITAQVDAQGTVHLLPAKDVQGGTVLLEAVEVSEFVDTATPVEVSEAVDVPVGEPIEAPPAAPPPAAVEPPPVATEPPRPFRSKSRDRDNEAEMDMTPMVDVTFLLLIFFMVTATFTLQKSLEIPKVPDDDPSANAIETDPEEQGDFVTVLVDEFNTFQVITVDWEKEAPGEQDLHLALREARDGDSTGTIPTKLRVEAHGNSDHGKVVAALDAGTANGFEEVQLASLIEQ